MFSGDSFGERWTTATGLDPEGMSAISRGLSVRDTPGREEFGQTDLHPEGMPARFSLAGIGNLPASLQDANPFARIHDRGCRRRSTPGYWLASLRDEIQATSFFRLEPTIPPKHPMNPFFDRLPDMLHAAERIASRCCSVFSSRSTIRSLADPSQRCGRRPILP